MDAYKRKIIIIAIAACLFDISMVFPIVGYFALFYGVIKLIISIIKAVIKRGPPIFKPALLIIVLFLFEVFIVVGVVELQFMVAKTRAKKVISALKLYHSKYGIYPEKLKELMPEFLSSIPKTGIPRCYNFLYKRGFFCSEAGNCRPGNPQKFDLCICEYETLAKECYGEQSGSWYGSSY